MKGKQLVMSFDASVQGPVVSRDAVHTEDKSEPIAAGLTPEAERLLEKFEVVAGAPGGVKRLRELILELAVRGKLVPQDPRDEPAAAMVERMSAERQSLISAKQIHRSEELPALPSGWRWSPLGHLGRTVTGNTPPTNNPELYGSYMPFVSPGDLNNWKVEAAVKGLSAAGTLIARTVSQGALLMVCIGGSIGKTSVASCKLAFNQQINAIEPDPSVESEYLLVALRSTHFQREVRDRAGQGTLPILSKSKWVDIHVPIPPLAEQKRIVAKVDDLMKLCDDLEARQAKQRETAGRLSKAALGALASAEGPEELAESWRRVAGSFEGLIGAAPNMVEVRQTIVALAVQGRLDSYKSSDEPVTVLLDKIGQARNTTSAKRRNQELPAVTEAEIPFSLDHWAWERLDRLAEVVGGVTKGRDLRERQVASYPYLRVANVQRGFLDLGLMKEIEIPTEELEKYRLRQGDVLFTEGGDWDKLGRSAVWEAQLDMCLHQNHVFRARMLVSDLNPYWFSLYANSPIGRRYFEDAAKQTTNLASINMTQLRNCPMPIPPAAEQTRILRRVDQLMALCDTLEAALRRKEDTARRLADALVAELLG